MKMSVLQWRMCHAGRVKVLVLFAASLVLLSLLFLQSSKLLSGVSPWVSPREAGPEADVHNPTIQAPHRGFRWRPEDASFKQEYVRRRNVADAACMKTGVQKGEVWYLARYGVTSDRMTSYCGIAKVACTFWLSVLLFLANDTNGRHFESPLDMSRIDVHYVDNNLTYYMDEDVVADDFRFMFVREPYSRLWSAYVDKFLLPDFWLTDGLDIVKKRRRRKSRRRNTCASDVSFAEFADFVAATKPWMMNSHWKPVFYQCSPCRYRPHLIGKLETFARDAREVLTLMNASWVLDNYDPARRVKDEVKHLIAFNYYVAKVRDVDYNCTHTREVARRLWKAFQINGYLPDHLPFPTFPGQEVGETELREAVERAMREASSTSREEVKKQRQRAMVQAYKTVSSDTLYRLQDIYWNDFVMYDYHPQPDILFAGRRYT